MLYVQAYNYVITLVTLNSWTLTASVAVKPSLLLPTLPVLKGDLEVECAV